MHQNIRFDAQLILKVGNLELPLWMDIAQENITDSIKKATLFTNMLIVGKLKKESRTKLEKLNISYITDTGEYFLPITLTNVGNKDSSKVKPTPKQEVNSTFSSSLGMTKLIFALLSLPETHRMTQKQIANITGLSTAIVNRYIRQLERLSYLIKERSRIRLRKLDRLIDQWVFEFEKFIAPTLDSKRWRSQHPEILKDIRNTSYKLENGYWSGTKAADVLLHSELPSDFTIYSANLPKLIRELRLTPDPKGSISTRNQFWDFNWEQKENKVVPLPLIFSDLINSNDPRDSKVAEKIRRMIHDTI